MNKIGNIFQLAYLFFAVFFLYLAFVNWGQPEGKSYLFLIGSGLAIFKFFFNRKYRKRFEEHYKKRESEKKSSNK